MQEPGRAAMQPAIAKGRGRQARSLPLCYPEFLCLP
jgi:hypothetical protein